MKQQITVLIKKKHRNRVPQILGEVVYEHETMELGEVDAYQFYYDFYDEVGLQQILEPFGRECTISDRQVRFSKADNEKADVFTLIALEDGIDAKSDEQEGIFCHECNSSHYDKSNIHPLFVSEEEIKKYEISISDKRWNEIVIKESFAAELEEKFKIEANYYPVFDFHSGAEIKGYKRMIPQVGIGPLVRPTVVRAVEYCKACSSFEGYVLETPCFFEAESWSGLDFFYSIEVFGSREHGTPLIIVSQKFYQYLLKRKIKNFRFWPGFFVS